MKPVMPVGGNTGNACERQQNDDDVHKCARLRGLRRSGGCAAVLLLVNVDTGDALYRVFVCSGALGRVPRRPAMIFIWCVYVCLFVKKSIKCRTT